MSPQAIVATLLLGFIGIVGGVLSELADHRPDILSPVTNSEQIKVAQLGTPTCYKPALDFALPILLKDLPTDPNATVGLAPRALRETKTGPYQHVLGHINCPACEAIRISIMPTPEFADLTVAEALPIWLSGRTPYLKPATIKSYQFLFTNVIKEYGGLRLRQIGAEHFRAYQGIRSKTAGPSCINHELNALSQVLRRAGLWAQMQDFIEPLPLPRWIPPRVVTEEEEDHLFDVATRSPEWLVAYLCASITANTTAQGKELLHLRLKNLDLDAGIVYIPSDAVKNEFRARVLPLNERAKLQFARLKARANEIGCFDPDHYLIPFRIKRNHYDPTRPATSYRTAWRKIRTAAGFPWLRPRDLRHQIITRLLENPNISEETVKSIAGHVGRNILNTYSHVRIKAKREALAMLQPIERKPSRGMEIVTGRKQTKSSS